MASLSIRDVYKTYPNGVPVLKGVNIDIEDGQFLILVGGSGCGKSTLLNMIAGLETVTKGDIQIGGKTVNNLSPKDRDIAMVFQSYALYPSMTVRENISFGLNIRKVAKGEQDQIVARVSKLLQIEHLLDRKPGQLSGGQRQRVAMGRALARDPAMFLVIRASAGARLSAIAPAVPIAMRFDRSPRCFARRGRSRIALPRVAACSEETVACGGAVSCAC